MLRTNIDRLVKISVVGEVASSVFGKGVYNISAEGTPTVLLGVSGITYNVRVGDRACGWEADHVEPGVTTLFTSSTGKIVPKIDAKAIITSLLKLRADI